MTANFHDISESRHSGAGSNHRKFDGRTFLGVLFVVIGLALIADNFDWIPYGTARIIISWPMLLIAVGLYNLIRQAWFAGFIITGVGLFFMLPKVIDVSPDYFANFWPFLLIFLGLVFIFYRGYRWKGSGYRSESRNDYLDEIVIFGGKEAAVVSENFMGGKVTSIFGGSTLNLLKSKPAKGCLIDVASIFGGTKLIVPEEWNVKIETVSIFGGFTDKRGQSSVSRTDPEKVVVIKGACIFGGGEIVSIP